ncbi:hypothetical protein QTP86_000905 [Hemibagrus guttatus]|nr:hypothetical protein QTP86_000905 [Hemibagrus guttatus]
MANMSGPLTIVEMQTIRVDFTGEKIFRVALVVFTLSLFIYVNIVMLFTLRTKAIFRETPRYILFAHMLLNDTIHLIVTLLTYMFNSVYFMLVRAVCAFMVLVSSTTFVNAPLNLAVMSLERYTAICFPLRHSELATPARASMAVALVWVLGISDVLTDVCALFLLAEPSFYLSPSVCTMKQLIVAPWQQVRSLMFKVLLFIMVTIVLLYTYVSILRQARAASSDTSAHKALRTMILHALQLGLSLMSFSLYEYIEYLLVVARLCGSVVDVFRRCCSAMDVTRPFCSDVDVAGPFCSAVDVARRFCSAVDDAWDPLALPSHEINLCCDHWECL